MRSIWIVEDDENIRELVLYALRASGYDGAGFESGPAFFKALDGPGAGPALVLLDIMLPEMDGLAILKRLREGRRRALPVIMLSAKGGEFDKVKGLDMGADDYIAKPFGVTELMSRVGAVLRRAGEAGEPEQIYAYRGILMDNRRHVVLAEGAPVTLTFKEYELLQYLLVNAGLVLSRDRIIQAVWDSGFEGGSRTVDMHIKTLRQKLGPAGEHIRTIRGVGYKIGE